MSSVICPGCGSKDYTVLAGGCGQRTRMVYICRNKECKHRWNS
jgi:hypothetical protein